MITTQTLRSNFRVLVTRHVDDRSSLSRLLSAAVVSRQFRDLLLRDPQTALQRGFQGEVFSLTSEEQNLLISIRAESLADLAGQLTDYLGQ